MDFSDALRQLKRGKRVTISSQPSNWFLYFVPTRTVHVKEPPLSDFTMMGAPVGHTAHIMIRNADGTVAPWSPTVPDLLDQWCIIGADEEDEPRLFAIGVEK